MKHTYGFSLVELLLVIVLLVVAAAIAVPMLSGANRAAKVELRAVFVEEALDRLMNEAVTAGAHSRTWSSAEVPADEYVMVDPSAIVPPDGVITRREVLFAGATGYPHVAGSRACFGVVLADSSLARGATAVVVTPIGAVERHDYDPATQRWTKRAR